MSEDTSSLVEREIFLRKVNDTHTSSPPAALRYLAGQLKPRTYVAGQVLYTIGERLSTIVFLESGVVRLEHPTEAAWLIEAPGAVGMIDLLRAIPASRTAIAQTEVRAFELLAEEYFEVVADNFEWARRTVAFVYGAIERLGLTLEPEQLYPPVAAEDHLGALSPPLGLVERILALRRVPVFRALSLQVVVELAAMVEEVEHPAGHILHLAGAPSDSFWVVCRGSIRQVRRGAAWPSEFRPVSLVAPFAALSGNDERSEIYCSEPSTLLRLKKSDFFDAMEDHMDVTRALMSFAAGERERVQKILAAAGQSRIVPR